MTPPSFDDFFSSVWGYPPYPWQARLAARVADGGWPAVLDLPTGSGKTAVLDIALHHFVTHRHSETYPTRPPRRIILVVDRRVIVDQAADRAQRIRAALDRGDNAATRWVRTALREIVGGGAPLLVSPVLRGGTVRDDSWARYPHVPVLAASTVDQVGSRLLFRGYGLSDGARPIHAGLLGCDTLFLLDEVHLARPFASTLAQLADLRKAEPQGRRIFGSVELSATPGAEHRGRDVFGLDQSDLETPRLARILGASKPAHLVDVKVRVRGDEASKRAAVATEAARRALAMVAEGRKAIAVVVNRVDTARRVWRLLQDQGNADSELITGRMRPLDQTAAIDSIGPRVLAGRDVDPEGRPLVVVATQTIEAGADFDFDGLVTECAPIDALRQRFGRLDRRGEAEGRLGEQARAAVLARTDITKVEDPVYGEAVAKTWAWLHAVAKEGTVDFGIETIGRHLEETDEATRGKLQFQAREAPVLMPTYLEQWSQTRPRPHADPDVALFLHGIPAPDETVAAEVQLTWRADITAEALAVAAADRTTEQCLTERIAGLPPTSPESLSLPIWALRSWRRKESEASAESALSDVEGVAVAQGGGSSDLVLRWKGRRDSRVIPLSEVSPGDSIVVPATWGGIGPGGTFDPTATAPVVDLGDVAHMERNGRAVLRLHPDVWPVSGAYASLQDDERRDRLHVMNGIHDLLAPPTAAESGEHRRLKLLLDRLEGGFRIVSVPQCESLKSYEMLVGRSADRSDPDRMDLGSGGDDEDASFPGQAGSLEQHLESVSSIAEQFARRAGLREDLCATIRWAGRLHDIGKLDPRFQLMLQGGDEVAARFGEPLAKSPLPMEAARARSYARHRAGYPDGQRHELVSLDMIEGSHQLREAVESDGADWDMVLHLVASHHGWARPMAPAVTIPDHMGDSVAYVLDGLEITGNTRHGRGAVDSGVARRFLRLGRQHGWHEVAYLEAILRLADHRQSEWETSS